MGIEVTFLCHWTFIINQSVLCRQRVLGYMRNMVWTLNKDTDWSLYVGHYWGMLSHYRLWYKLSLLIKSLSKHYQN